MYRLLTCFLTCRQASGSHIATTHTPKCQMSIKVNVHHDKFSHYFDVLHSKSLLFVHFSVKDY